MSGVGVFLEGEEIVICSACFYRVIRELVTAGLANGQNRRAN